MKKSHKLNSGHRRPIKLSAFGTVLVLVCTCVLFTLTVLMIQPGMLSDTLRALWSDKLLIPLNVFPVCVVIVLCYCLTGNAFSAAGIGGLIVNLLSYVNLIKTDCRNDPFVPADCGLIREAVNAAGEYNLNLHWGIVVIMLMMSAVCFLLAWFTEAKKPRWYVRGAMALALIAVFGVSMAKVYQNTELYNQRGTEIEGLTKSNVPEVFRLCGFPYCFLHNYNLYSIEKPKGYQKSQVEEWIQSDEQSYSQPEVQPNIIFVMCEAYSDLADEDVFEYTEEDNPLHGFHVLAESPRARSGHIAVSNFGAGTANTEFDVLTGIQTNMVSPTNISSFRVLHKSINALPWDYQQAGYSTLFTHPGYSWFYNRENVYQFLGMEKRIFDESYTQEDRKGTMISDDAFAEHLIGELDQRLGGEKPLFAYGVTIQNHQSYPYAKYGFEPEKPPISMTISDDAMETLSVYMEGVRDSTAMLTKLCEYLDSREEPVLLVFYGDHRPTLGQDYGVYRELGVPVGEDDTWEHVLKTYETPYLIWANEAYAPYCDFDALELPETISSSYLGAAVYELTGMSGMDPYFDTLNSLRRSLPVINHDVYLNTAGNVIAELSKEQENQITQLYWWKYYRLKDETLLAHCAKTK